MSFSAVRLKVETELGAPLTALFSSFTEAPIDAAAIAQVHEATLMDGRHVAVKVQRSGPIAKIATDMAALKYLVELEERLSPRLRALVLPIVVREFSISLNREIDFNREAHCVVLYRTALADFPDDRLVVSPLADAL